MRKNLIRSFLSSSYHATKFYGLIRLRLQSLDRRRQSPIIVYQMGKVGSTSLVLSLRKSLKNEPVYQIHTLSAADLQNEEALWRKNFNERKKIGQYLLDSLYLKSKIEKGNRKMPWRIVTLVRDPVKRNISCFFEDLEAYLLETGFSERIKANDPSVIEDLIDCFISRFDHLYILDWFDNEIKFHFHIDILEEGFEPSNGFQLYKNDLAEVLLIRTEDLDRSCDSIAKFIGVGSFQLNNKNVAKEKYYSRAYEEFKKRLILPASLLDALYSSNYATNFYTDAERELQRNWWASMDLRQRVASKKQPMEMVKE